MLKVITENIFRELWLDSKLYVVVKCIRIVYRKSAGIEGRISEDYKLIVIQENVTKTCRQRQKWLTSTLINFQKMRKCVAEMRPMP